MENKAKEFFIKHVSKFVLQHAILTNKAFDFDGLLLELNHNANFKKNIVKRAENTQNGTIETVYKVNGKYVLASFLNETTPIEFSFVKPKRKKITVVEYLPIN